MFRNLYHIFDLPDFFEDDYELRRLYRILGSRWHPSRNVNMPSIAEKRFKELSKAFEILANQERRKRYNQLLKESQNEKEFNDVLEPFFHDRGFPHYDNFFKNMIGEENKLFNDDFFKETDEQFKKLSDDRKEEGKKEEVVKKNNSSPGKEIGYSKYVKKNTFIKDGKRFTITTKSWEDNQGNKNVETIEDHGDGKVIKNIEKIFHDEEGNLIKEVQEDTGKGLELKEKKLLQLKDGKDGNELANSNSNKVEDKKPEEEDIVVEEEGQNKMEIEK